MHVSDDPRVGTELAGYRIELLLGFGGMSVVYLAEDLRLKRKVALKLLAAHLAEDESFRERFLRESELAASIDHPNIVPIYEAGTTEDLLFIAMRYVEGRDLKARLQRRRLDPADAIGIVAQVASALDAAHARDLVHRDVKPSNVLLDTGARPDGSDHVYLADFGLTRSIAEAGVGEDGNLLGTIDYVAPEQIADAEIDGRADVYSLGCVLYECLVGQPPFRRDCGSRRRVRAPRRGAARAQLSRPELPVGARRCDRQGAGEGAGAALRELPRARPGGARDRRARGKPSARRRRLPCGRRQARLERGRGGAGRKGDRLSARPRMGGCLSGPATPARPAVERPCPFKGLASFEPVDAEYFFGREQLIAELVARLVGAGFLGIVGPSGSGKSSVLRAGLLPALAGGVLPGSGSWRRLLLRPGERPMEELRRVLVSGANDPLAEALDALPADGRLLLAVDQLEELFTACRSDVERAAFVAALSGAAADPAGRAVVVAALRADFYGRFAAHPALAELLGANHVLVGPMQASELRRAVELPAARVGLRVEPELADALVDDVEGEPGALPLLSTALLELWQKRQDQTLTLAAYRESGGVQGAVARLAEGTYERIPDERKPLVRALMLRLVGEGESDAPVRRRASLAELDLERDRWMADVLAALADSRLVTVGGGSVEVAHEALLREWPRLSEWIEEDAEGRRLRRHITRAATDWDAAGRDQGELFRGARLAAALDWTAAHALDVNELEREFVTESREASEQESKRARRTNRRLRVLLAGVAVLLAAALAGGLYAALQRGEARDAETAQVAQRLGAQALVEEDLDLSLLLARQAAAIDDTPQTRGYLLAALQRAPNAIGIMHAPADALLGQADLSPDGRTLAVIDFYDRILFFDSRTFQPVGRPFDAGEWLDSVAFRPNGKTLAYGTNGGSVGVLDARTHEQLAVRGVGGSAARLAFTNDGSRLVVAAGSPPLISVLDADTLKPVGPLIMPKGFRWNHIASYYRAAHFALTPDGRSVITASDNGELAWWDLQTGRETRSIEVARDYHAFALSRQGHLVAVGIDGGIQLVDVRTGKVTTSTAGFSGSPNALQFSRDGTSVVSANLDGTVTRWDTRSEKPLETLRGHSNAVQHLVFGRDGKTLYTVSSDGTAIAWDLTGRGGVKRSFRFTDDRDFDESYDRHPGRFSPDGRLIAVGLKRNGIGLRDARTLKRDGPPLLETGGEVKALSFSSDGRTLAAVTNGQASIWDVESRSLRHGGIPARGLQVGVVFTKDGTTVVTTSSNGIELWDAETGESTGRIPAYLPYGGVPAFSDDGALLAVAGGGGGVPRAEVWDVARRSRVAALEGGPEGDGLSVALTPDGGKLALGGYGKVVRLWDVRTGKLIHVLDTGRGGAASLEFSADGSLLAVSGLGEPAASLWDVGTGTRIGPSLTAGRRTAMVDLSSDGRRLLLTLANGEAAVFDVDPESWARRACALANRALTREEWERFLPGRPYEPACA